MHEGATLMTDRESLKVVATHLSVGESFQRLVVDETIELIHQIREVLDGARTSDETCVRLALLVVEDEAHEAHDAAAIAAAANAAVGIAQSLTLELGSTARVNVIRCRSDDGDVVGPTLELLDSPEAAFIAGSTFDLRELA